ncbi:MULTISPECIES: M28 family peptidase [unclassified Colwellia]|uniref:M28 family peptidase n=1 Tax=unclassified Colwellia TaxID=196834 RepID=UPI0015F4A38A|nr:MULTISPECIES: M28 family peptidase [unclassified Colwellia]MBA6233633.1 M28 family peptidase [Colwellia sp. MB02u-7]MBA6238193.1 M28 family peptidase [Colwellia sp. MB02u-11]MBA6255043.1 M28 family peptidase [Colwellia sp. MB3u-28]MBA6259006.1 M28 family peptidase [Colwellia sp. MB3u-41]MBA6299670.1 M28 family peptidase [Colwellia sp. MB3u-22]
MKSLPRLLTVIMICLISLWILIARPFITSHSVKIHDIDPKLLKEEVRRISQDFYPRDSQNPEILASLSEYIFTKFKTNTKTVEFQKFKAGGHEYRNVIAKFGPNTDNVIVIGAHYDSYSNLPAADDNASGVSGLFELSRLLKKMNLKKQVHLVAFSLEEPPYFASEKMGSYIHAKSLKEAGINIDLMISLEMIGFFSDEDNSQTFPIPMLSLMYPSTGNFVAIVDQIFSNKAFEVKSAINMHTNINAYSINAPHSLTGVDWSDHRNYWAMGFPAVMITNTSFYRNKSYHTDADTFDKLNYEKMAEVIYGVFRYIQSSNSET